MKQKLIVIASLIVFLFAAFAVSKLEILSNMEDMLSTDSASYRASKDFNQYFTGQDQAVIVVKQADPALPVSDFQQQAEAFVTALGTGLAQEPYVSSLLYQVDLSAIAPFAWAYLDMDLYHQLSDAMDQQDFPALTKLLLSAQTQLTAQAQKDSRYIVSDDGTQYLLYLKPVIDDSDYLQSRSDFYYGTQAHLAALLGDPAYSQIDAGLTGGTFIQDIEADTVAFDGLFGTLAVTLVLILLIVVLFFGSLKLPLLSLYPLLLGTVTAAAFAYVVYGSLNMFAVSFALLLLGLGIDYAVHLITRYQEERGHGLPAQRAVCIAQKATGQSIVIGALTTALAFACFAFAQFRAFAQMGIVSAAGILSLCACMLLLMPALILLLDTKPGSARRQGASAQWMQPVTRFIVRRRKLLFLAILLVLAALSPFVAQTKLQSDLSVIYPKNIPSLHWAEELEKAFDYDVDTLSFYADNEAQLRDIYNGLTGNAAIREMDSVLTYMPDTMEEKLEILLRLDTLLQSKGLNALDDFDLRPMTLADLPLDIQANYIGLDGKLRVDIMPAISLYEPAQYRALLSAILSLTGRQPVGMATLMNEITDMVRSDIVMISLVCFAIAFLISWLMFRRLKLAVLTTLPLLVTLYSTLGLLNALHISINVFSIAAFPLIIGIGVDSGIHLLHRLREEDGQNIASKTMHTGKAIITTTLTTVIGFGSLGLINHPGMASLGLTVTIGIGLSMLYTLTLIPAGFAALQKKQP